MVIRFFKPAPSHELVKAIGTAAETGDVNRVEALLNEDSRLVNTREDGDGFTPLHKAVSRGHVDVVRVLLAHGAKVKERDKLKATPLHRAANAEVARLLLAHGAKVKERDKNGDTPLHKAAYVGHTEVAKLLLAEGAEVNARNNAGYTPLSPATFGGCAEVADMLLTHGAQVDDKGTSNMTPLYSSAYSGHVEVARVLLAHGAEVNWRDEWGSTPLHNAVSAGHTEMAKLLLAEGAEVNARNNAGYTPLCGADNNTGARVQMTELLLSRGASVEPLMTAKVFTSYPFDPSMTSPLSACLSVEIWEVLLGYDPELLLKYPRYRAEIIANLRRKDPGFFLRHPICKLTERMKAALSQGKKVSEIHVFVEGQSSSDLVDRTLRNRHPELLNAQPLPKIVSHDVLKWPEDLNAYLSNSLLQMGFHWERINCFVEFYPPFPFSTDKRIALVMILR